MLRLGQGERAARGETAGPSWKHCRSGLRCQTPRLRRTLQRTPEGSRQTCQGRDRRQCFRRRPTNQIRRWCRRCQRVPHSPSRPTRDQLSSRSPGSNPPELAAVAARFTSAFSPSSQNPRPFSSRLPRLLHRVHTSGWTSLFPRRLLGRTVRGGPLVGRGP